ncbi:MAG: hypothetical protein HUU37_09030 [Bdellovibrionales bacterium]|nr:hypothetical protein [Bdellovibrionales bacterium]
MKRFEIPAKTFLLGEYAVLDGGKALVALTQPSFVLEAGGEECPLPFHPASPAGKLFQVMPGQKRQNIRWENPWTDRGGFGASSAEFVGMFLAHESTIEDPRELAWNAWKIFRLMTAQMRNRPSGADVLAQAWGAAGKISSPAILALDLGAHTLEPAAPSRLGLKIELFHTGEKLPTHEHLSGELSPFPTEEANGLVGRAIQALAAGDGRGFVEAVRDYGALLERTERVAPHTEKILRRLRLRKEVLAAKGCGAMGSDVVFAVSESGSGEPEAVAAWDI